MSTGHFNLYFRNLFVAILLCVDTYLLTVSSFYVHRKQLVLFILWTPHQFDISLILYQFKFNYGIVIQFNCHN